MLRIVAATAIVLLSSASAGAQSVTTVPIGARVRVEIAGPTDRWSVGVVTGVSAPTVASDRRGSSGEGIRLPGPSAATNHHGKTWGLFGALVGGIAGGLLTFKSTESVEHNVTNVPLGVLGGGVAGGLIGYAIGRTMGQESPAPATTAGLHLTIAPRAIGVGVMF